MKLLLMVVKMVRVIVSIQVLHLVLFQTLIHMMKILYWMKKSKDFMHF